MSFDSTLDGGWQTPEVASAQRALVERELEAPLSVDPYWSCLRALARIAPPRGAHVLDVGCGVGHYGTLLRRFWPALRYTGTDVSGAMIAEAQAREPDLHFRVVEFAANDFGAADLVLAAQCLEMTPDPWQSLAVLLAGARGPIILHRLRLAETARRLAEATYAGHTGQAYLWRLDELASFITARRWAVERVPFGPALPAGRLDMATLILWPQP